MRDSHQILTVLCFIFQYVQAISTEGWFDDCLSCIPTGFFLDVPDDGCVEHVGQIYCGRYKMSEGYFVSCAGRDGYFIGRDFRGCALNMNCSRQCAKEYFRKYENGCALQLKKSVSSLDCRDYATMHALGGFSGCENRLKNDPLDFIDYVNIMAKTCPELVGPHRNLFGGSEKEGEEQSSEVNDHTTIVIAASCTAVAVVVVVLIISAILLYKFRPAKSNENIHDMCANMKNPEEMRHLIRQYGIPRSQIIIMDPIGFGNFGKICKGEISAHPKDCNDVDRSEGTIAVKSLRDIYVNAEGIEAFLKEALIMSGFAHPNVLHIIGICWDEEGPPLMVLPFMENGDLLSLVKSAKIPFNLCDLLYFLIQISEGMAYLATNKFVHRDLAARNCLVSHSFWVKISDFGLSRDVYETEIYKLKQNETGSENRLLPWKWMAPECIQKGHFSTRSDMWSFGVLMWELFTSGSTPYPAIDNLLELDENLSAGYRLTKPDQCPDEIHEIMSACWEVQPLHRPTFPKTVDAMKKQLKVFENDIQYSYAIERTGLPKGSDNEVVLHIDPIPEDTTESGMYVQHELVM